MNTKPRANGSATASRWANASNDLHKDEPVSSALNRTNVVALIVLFALMRAIGLPYLQQSREAERRTVSEYRMGQVARSILEYEDSHTEFPGYRNVITIGANKPYTALINVTVCAPF